MAENKKTNRNNIKAGNEKNRKLQQQKTELWKTRQPAKVIAKKDGQIPSSLVDLFLMQHIS